MRTALFSELSETDTCIKVTILIFTDFAGKLSDFLSKSAMCNPGEETLVLWGMLSLVQRKSQLVTGSFSFSP